MLTVKSFAFNPFSENTYLVYDEDKNTYLIDPGNWDTEENQILERYIMDNNLKINKILLTHAHIDHVLGLQWASEKYRVPIVLHQEDHEILNLASVSAQKYRIPYQPFTGKVDFVSENEILSLGQNELKIYHVPGHSPGSVAFHSEKDKFIISGDVLFLGSIGRADLYKGNHHQLLNSIRQKLFVLDDETIVYNGHGSPTKIGFEKKTNPFF